MEGLGDVCASACTGALVSVCGGPTSPNKEKVRRLLWVGMRQRGDKSGFFLRKGGQLNIGDRVQLRVQFRMKAHAVLESVWRGPAVAKPFME